MKKLISLLIASSFLIGMCSISASAALDYTNTYYMNGYKLRGSTVMNDKVASSSTYCENYNYGKSVQLNYYHYYGHEVKCITRGDVDTFVTNGFDTYSASYTNNSSTDEYLGAIGSHKVKATSYMIWSSHESEDDSHVGSVVPDYSDI